MNTSENFSELLRKYNVPAPRYTSYPTVPYWDSSTFSQEAWVKKVRQAQITDPHISLYIHLPYCEELCTYCGCNKHITKNHSVEQNYIGTLLKEWDLYLEILSETPIISEVHLGGGTPTFFSPDNLKWLIESIFEKAHNTTQTSDLSFEAHPANTTYAHLKTLAEVGFKRLSLGIQDFDPEILQIINRKQLPEQIFSCTQEARSLGYNSINFDFVYGLPKQKKHNMRKNIAQINRLKPERIALYSYAHVPWKQPGQRAYSEKDLPSPTEKRQLYDLGKTLLLENGYEEIGLDHFALPQDALYKAKHNHTLHRNFMGYTPNHSQLMIGLGSSAISDAWEAFSQNEKTVRAYMLRIAQNQLAIQRGHLLSNEDLRIRKHILNLMCRLRTRWETQDKPFLPQVFERLKPLQTDQLLRIDTEKLEVLPKGQAFLRNICMGLDERLWENQPETAVFSQSV